jgi:serine/threonine protein kinase/tetratricopeptide (TPR) repeat protein
MAAEIASLDTIFCAAVEKASEPERVAYVAAACGDNQALRAQVEKLLAAHFRAGSFLQQPAEAAARTGPFTPGPLDASGPSSSEAMGGVIGPYKLVEAIGEGGMGTVWLAQQTEPVKRLVALKVIKPGMDSKLVLARFEAERQALALMDHPNIAKVLDAGTTATGRPYFVMELVKGVPLTKYCDEHRLTPRERLELFMPVCQAIQHAHQKGIIHRDIKPSNVLVALYDGKPVPKVIDFGIAKAAGQQLTDRTLVTGFGAVVGTLEYMSPEQAELNQLDIDTRSDIYSLGVLLYELLTGTTPLQKKRLTRAAMLEVLRLIREEEPPRPSTRLSESKDSLPSISAQRQTEPAKLTKLVRGELDWIVMKALEKDRNRRYESANGLGLDILRYLHDEPVAAGPPSNTYRLKKFLRRNRGPVLAAAFVLVTLVGGIVGTTFGLLRALAAEGNEREQRQLANQRWVEAEKARAKEASERSRAEQQKQIAQAVRDFLRYKLLGQAALRDQADTLLRAGRDTAEAKENPTVRELLDRAARELTPEKIEAQFPNQPQVQAEILHTIGMSYWAIAEYRSATTHLRREYEMRQRLGQDLETAEALSTLALAYYADRNPQQAIRLFQRARDTFTSKFGPEDPNTLSALFNLAMAYKQAGQLAEAITLFERVQADSTKKFGPNEADHLTILNGLAATYLAMGDHKRAIRLLEGARDTWTKKLGPEHPDILTVLHGLAMAYKQAGEVRKAIPLLERVRTKRMDKFGADHPETLTAQRSLALAYAEDGRLADGLPLLEEVRERLLKKLGPENPATWDAMEALAAIYRMAGRSAQVISGLEEVWKKRVARFGDNHPDTLHVLISLALAYQAAGRPAEAIPLLQELVKKLDHHDVKMLAALNNLATAYQAIGKSAEAITHLEQLRTQAEKQLGASHPNTLMVLHNLGVAYWSAGQFDRAEKVFQEALEKKEKLNGPNHPDTLATLVNLANNYRDAKRFREAVALLERAQERVRRLRRPLPTQLDSIPLDLAVAYQLAGQLDKAEALTRASLKEARRELGEDHPRTARLLADMGTLLLDQNKFAAAERVFRECLVISTKIAPESWSTFRARSVLGSALAGQKKYAAAEPLLLSGYLGLRERATRIPLAARGRTLDLARYRIVQLYEAWGKADEAAKWRGQRKATPAPKPAVPPEQKQR